MKIKSSSLIIYFKNRILDETNYNLHELAACVDVATAVSKPLISLVAGNLFLSAGILFTGNSYTSFAPSVAKVTNLQIFSDRNFNSAGGDGRCNSPGHSAWCQDKAHIAQLTLIYLN